ncbi:hypothetical protein SAMN05428948_3383 [Massilia sp. CF038]|nr:hypothetical protein SAMN05428948_3383 [Massilia sp. CF038]
MSSYPIPPLAIFSFLGFTILAYVSVPLFLRFFSAHAPSSFDELGRPKASTIFSRSPSDWKIQFRFVRFVLTGHAWRLTSGWIKALACVVWISYAGLYGSLLWLAYALLLS